MAGVKSISQKTLLVLTCRYPPLHITTGLLSLLGDCLWAVLCRSQVQAYGQGAVSAGGMLCVTRVVGAQLPARSISPRPALQQRFFCTCWILCSANQEHSERNGSGQCWQQLAYFQCQSSSPNMSKSGYLFLWLPRLTSCPWRWMSREQQHSSKLNFCA